MWFYCYNRHVFEFLLFLCILTLQSIIYHTAVTLVLVLDSLGNQHIKVIVLIMVYHTHAHVCACMCRLEVGLGHSLIAVGLTDSARLANQWATPPILGLKVHACTLLSCLSNPKSHTFYEKTFPLRKASSVFVIAEDPVVHMLERWLSQ